MLSSPLGRTRDVAGPLPQREASPDGRCRQNSNVSSAEPVLSRVARPTAPLPPPGWRSGDRSQRMGPQSHPLWEWQPDTVRPGRRGWHLMPSYGERLGDGAVCPLCRETASSEAEMSHCSRVDPLPSSEAEVCCVTEGPEGSPRARRKMSYPLEGISATLERGGDWSPARG